MTAKHARPEAPTAEATAAQVTAAEAPAPLTLADICDHGGDGDVTAQVLVGKDGRVLMFCKHHFEASEPGLAGQGFAVLQDNRGQLA